MEERRKVTFNDIWKDIMNANDKAAGNILSQLFGQQDSTEDIYSNYQEKIQAVTKVYRRPKPKSVLVNGDYTTVGWKETNMISKRPSSMQSSKSLS